MSKLTPQEILDLKAVTFFTETCLHLQPGKFAPDVTKAYLAACDRLKPLMEVPSAPAN